MIFNYYEERAYTLYKFVPPGFISTEINIPLFVSNNYLVFVPDIHFSIAKLSGKTNFMNAYNALVSAAKYFCKFSWVDSTRMGLNGHSFGGAITEYLVSHTHIFAAAVASSGTTDFVSSYLSLGGPVGHWTGRRIDLFEQVYRQGRLGVSLWQRPNFYLNSSAVLKANQVTTPLLIMHNIEDPAVPWQQGIEMFLALQRLGKKVWLLQYDNGSHGVYGKDAVDYTVRFTQFFDYYLKGALPPKWMTDGVPARLKGIETGYELDKSGKIP